MKTIICPCGKEVEVKPWTDGRKKYCSKSCFYKYRKRPNGLDYKIVVQNKGWFPKGHTPWTKGSKGLISAWNKGIKGTHFSPKTEFNSKVVSGKKNCNWKGNNVGYFALHGWIKRHYGAADFCENRLFGKFDFLCNGKSKKYDWSLIKGKGYKRNIKNFQKLCHSCHLKYDKQKD